MQTVFKLLITICFFRYLLMTRSSYKSIYLTNCDCTIVHFLLGVLHNVTAVQWFFLFCHFNCIKSHILFLTSQVLFLIMSKLCSVYHLEITVPVGWLLLVGCLTSQQHASVSQGRICSDNFTCCHMKIEAADPILHLTQSQYTDTGPTSPSTDPILSGAWQGSHWSANFEVTGMTRSGNIPQDSNPGSSALEADALTTRQTRRSGCLFCFYLLLCVLALPVCRIPVLFICLFLVFWCVCVFFFFYPCRLSYADWVQKLSWSYQLRSILHACWGTYWWLGFH